jgi:hypothetical protein
MRVYEGLLSEAEVLGVRQTLESHNPPVVWTFDRDNTRFVCNVTESNDASMKYKRIIDTIFNRFCESNGVHPKEVLQEQIILMVQDGSTEPRVPYTSHDVPHRCFIYYVTSSDGLTVIGDEQLVAEEGKAVSFDGLLAHTHNPPQKDMFAMMIEVTFRA